jgi:hypothetical protein
MYWYSWVIGFLVLFNIYVIYRAVVIQKALSQSLIDNQIAISMMAAMKEELENSSKFKDDSNEDFIKFLSDSRDWAFDYIENTMAKINEIIEYCRKETNKSYIADYRTGPILMNIVKELLPLVEQNNDKQ